MSSQLVWKIVNDQSSFLKKQCHGNRRAIFTAEPFNMTRVNSYAASGLAQPKAAGISIEKSAKNNDALFVVLHSKSAKNANKPRANHVRTTLKPNVKKAAKAISVTVGSDLYRADLKKVALGRWSKAAKGVAANKRGFKQESLGRSGNKFGRRF